MTGSDRHYQLPVAAALYSVITSKLIMSFPAGLLVQRISVVGGWGQQKTPLNWLPSAEKLLPLTHVWRRLLVSGMTSFHIKLSHNPVASSPGINSEVRIFSRGNVSQILLRDDMNPIKEPKLQTKWRSQWNSF